VRSCICALRYRAGEVPQLPDSWRGPSPSPAATLPHAVTDALCASRPAHRSTSLSKSSPFAQRTSSITGRSLFRRESGVRALVRATVRGIRGSCATLLIGLSLRHQAEPTSAGDGSIFMALGWPCEGHDHSSESHKAQREGIKRVPELDTLTLPLIPISLLFTESSCDPTAHRR
jgi:hypothetical protein